MWAKARRLAVVSILVAIGAVVAMLAPFPIPFRGWLRGDRDEVPTELVADESRPGG